MGYKIGNDNGRVEGSFETLTVEDVVGKFEYGKRDRSFNDKTSEEIREWDNSFVESEKNDTNEIVKEVTSDSEVNT